MLVRILTVGRGALTADEELVEMRGSSPKPLRDVLLAFARVHILHHAAEDRIFGAGMAEELSRHGYRLGPGTLYPILHRLRTDGLLSMDAEVIDGKKRKYYRITAKGRASLKGLLPQLEELADEVLPDGATGQRGRKRRTAGH
jgi:DNA-binding PadR family transcriptional regulator